MEEAMHILEEKVSQLIGRAQALKAQNRELVQLHAQLQERIELLETSLLVRDQSSREAADAKVLVDSMIASINEIIEGSEEISNPANV